MTLTPAPIPSLPSLESERALDESARLANQERLLDAIRAQNIPAIKAALENGAVTSPDDADEFNMAYRHPKILAVETGNEAIMDLVMPGFGPNTRICEDSDATVALMAMGCGHARLLEKWAREIDWSSASGSGGGFLARAPNLALLEFALNYGADFWAVNKNGKDAMSRAAERGDWARMDLLANAVWDFSFGDPEKQKRQKYWVRLAWEARGEAEGQLSRCEARWWAEALRKELAAQVGALGEPQPTKSPNPKKRL